jgi:hypothetical protein
LDTSSANQGTAVALEPGVRAEFAGRATGDTEAETRLMAEAPKQKLRGKRLREARGAGNAPTRSLDRPHNPHSGHPSTPGLFPCQSLQSPNENQDGAGREHPERDPDGRDQWKRGREQPELTEADTAICV